MQIDGIEETSQARVYKSDLARLQHLTGLYRQTLGTRFNQQQIIRVLIDRAFQSIKSNTNEEKTS